MSTDDRFDQDEAFALEAYAALPRAQPTSAMDARILAAAGAVNATRRPRRWTTGLATAAVALLAVGLTWRGLEPAPPDYAPRKAPQLVPTLQPAFKLETVPPAAREQGTGEDVRARTSAPQTPAAPAMSTTDWEAPASRARVTERVSKTNPQSVPAPEYGAPIFDEPLPMSESSPAPAAPAAPPAPGTANQLSESVFVDDAAPSSQPVEQRSQSDRSSYRAEPAPQTQEKDQVSSAEAFDSVELQKADADSQELDEGKLSHSSPARAAGSAATLSQGKPDVANGEQSSEQRANSVQASRAQRITPVTVQSIRNGFTPYVEAIDAARSARVRGDVATARLLVSAIAARFGQRRVPADLRNLLPDQKN